MLPRHRKDGPGLIREFSQQPLPFLLRQRRHAFIACLVTFHCVDYLTYPKSSRNMRDRFRKRSPDFAIVDRVANAFKHVETGHPDAPQNQPLTVTSVFERPPGMAGVM
jgi:hypothetical protein